MHENAPRGRAGLTAAWLAGGRLLDRLSLALLLLALAAAFWGQRSLPVLAALLLAVVLGCLQKYYALRVAFDRRVFADWARQWSAMENFDPAVALAEFDEALVGMGLRRPGRGGLRSLDERIAGSRALLRRQAVCLSLQGIVLLAAAVLHLAHSPSWPWQT